MLHCESNITSWVWHHWNDASNPNTSCAFTQFASLLPIFSRRLVVPLRVKSTRFNAPPLVLDQSKNRRSWLPARCQVTTLLWIIRYAGCDDQSRSKLDGDLGGIRFIYVESTLRVGVIVLTQSSHWDLSRPSPVRMKYIITRFAG